MPSMMHLNSDGLKALRMDVTEFVVEEGAKMSKAAKEYIKTTQEAIKWTLSHMPPGGSIVFSLPEPGEGAEVESKWLQTWKDRLRRGDANQSQSQSGNSHSRDEINTWLAVEETWTGRNRARTCGKTVKTINVHLIDFHFKLLVDLLQGQSEVADAVLLRQDSLTIMNAGANSRIFH